MKDSCWVTNPNESDYMNWLQNEHRISCFNDGMGESCKKAEGGKEKIQVGPIGYLNELALFFFAGSAILSVDMLVNLPIRNAFSRERILRVLRHISKRSR